MRRSLSFLLALAAGACAPSLSPAGAASVPAAAPAVTPAGARAATAAALDSIFDDPAFATAYWGVLVRSLETGETLYARNAERMFVPASNTKLVTGAVALEALGAEHRYRTAVVAAGPLRDGVLEGDLVVVGSGDPTISDRFAPDARAVLAAWADSLRARGVTRIAGRVVGDDRVFDALPLGRGWAWDDVEAAYSAEVSGLPFNEGAAALRVHPGAAGAPARVELLPPTGYLALDAEVRTTPAGTAPALSVERSGTGRSIRVSGTVPAGAAAVERRFAVPDNTAYFLAVLSEVLAAAGIAVEGRPLAAGRADTLFTHRSPPLPDVVAAMMKPSQNQIAEVLLKTLGAELRGEGSAAAGATVVDSVLAVAGLPRHLLSQVDGSGLSRYNLVAPAFLVALLEREAESPRWERFEATLPVAGVDGTLAGRMRGTPLEENVRAKTGTLTGVRALSGYLTTSAGEPLVFSVIVNHHTRTAADADRVTEAALLRLYALPRTR